ncbi:MAG: molybdopterin cofactor-binding domain-containing protein [Thiotrichales bacterium]
MNGIIAVDRRTFLKAGLALGAGLVLGVNLPVKRADAAMSTVVPFAPNAFVRIGVDNTVTVIAKHLEMGQGVYTGLATLVAEELNADWNQVRVEGAPANAELYQNLFWPGNQGTGGSTAMPNAFEQMRKAGAAAREMLQHAAAKRWGVPVAELIVREGIVRHAGSNRSATFGELAEAASNEAVPSDVFLKEPRDFRLIGKVIPRKDTPEKINGSAIYTADVRLPGMLTAVVAHPPRFGAKVKAFDADSSRRIPGVVAVVQIPAGVAVLGRNFWSAQRGRDALKVTWDESGAFALGSDQIYAQYQALAQKPGAIATDVGDAPTALAQAAKIIEAEYQFPFLAHASMEPLNCVVQITGLGCEIWNGVQGQTRDQKAVAALLGIKPEQVEIHMLYAGGSFGRRGNPVSDYVLEAASIAKASGLTVPIKMQWTREDDMRAGHYRPVYVHRVRAALDGDGKPLAWEHRIVGQSIFSLISPNAGKPDWIDPTSVEGAAELPYAVPHHRVELHTTELGVPIQWWRSVGSTHTAYAVETMIDALATAAGQDPFAFRHALMAEHPRERAVLALAADKAGWGKPLTKGRGRGIAVHKSFNSYVAQVAEVTVRDDLTYTVDRVVIAVDCGLPINPDVIRAQMEGGMGYGLAAALNEAITLDQGRVEQSNFHDFALLRIDEMPVVEVHIVPSSAPPTGVGEPATPVIAPAVANALFAATGQRLRQLPLRLHA